MPNRRDTLLARHWERVFAHSPTEVVYRRALPPTADSAAIELAITVVKGRTPFESTDENGLMTTVQVPDFLVRTEDLEHNGQLLEPKHGDLIIELGSDGNEHHHMVCAPSADEPAWRWADASRSIRRIHTKLVSVEVPAP